MLVHRLIKYNHYSAYFILCIASVHIIIRSHHNTTCTYVDVTDQVVWSVGFLSVTVVSPAKTAELIEMPFGLRTRVGPRNHVRYLMGSKSPMGRSNFKWERGRELRKSF